MAVNQFNIKMIFMPNRLRRTNPTLSVRPLASASSAQAKRSDGVEPKINFVL